MGGKRPQFKLCKLQIGLKSEELHAVQYLIKKQRHVNVLGMDVIEAHLYKSVHGCDCLCEISTQVVKKSGAGKTWCLQRKSFMRLGQNTCW